ncbi:hypothetical protein HB847_03655 [Listeria booriae]|uniref:Lipoprotein n=1 Tax=Listeria booriae TaxID=1552123 RepID=A0A841Y2B0_9LIST|nr:hypothetical protein [Listeria booriae]MBC1371453.1 hypothetical protein [Listeria booriae]
MRKIVIAILSLMFLSGCSLFSDEEKEMKQTIPEITLKSSPNTELKATRCGFTWLGATTKAYLPTPKEFFKNEKLVRVSKTDQVRVATENEVRMGLFKKVDLDSMQLSLVLDSGEFEQVALMERDDGRWEFSVPQKSGKYMYLLDEGYQNGDYEVSYYFGLEISE